MKKTLIALIVMTILVCVGSGWATPVTVDRVPGYFSGNGGEFNIAGYGAATLAFYDTKATAVNYLGILGFETFCVETDENVNIPGTYNAELNPNDQAVRGGSNTDSNDTISVGTAYLYWAFSEGILTNYRYDGTSTSPFATRALSAGALQNTIWALEDETGYSVNSVFAAVLTTQFGSSDPAVWKANVGYDWGVGVLNLKYTNGNLAQDQLVRTGEVPEPTTLILYGLGFAGAGLYRRRKRRPK